VTGLVAAPLVLALSLPAQAEPDPSAARARSGAFLQAYAYYTVGDYGTDKAIWRGYFPLTLGCYRDRFLGSVTAPFIAQESGAVASVGGYPIPFDPLGAGAEDEIHVGLGDLLANAGYFALLETSDLPYLLLQGEAKVPTADETEGLGTGEFDFFLRATAGKDLGRDFKAFAQLGYGFIGDPGDSGVEARDAVYWSAGAAWKPAEGNELWLIGRGNGPVFKGLDPAAEILVQFATRAGEGPQLYFLAGAGLTDSSPDLILGAGFRILF
jgi:hypothetical protein